MRDNLVNVLKLSTNNEGGYSNHPRDPGGPTNHGITQGTLSSYLRRPATIADVKALSLQTANFIYEKSYAKPIYFDQLPRGFDYALFDFGINAGVSRAIKEIQKIVGTNPDGVMGAKTIAAILAGDPSDLIRKLCDARLKFCRGLRTWGTFGRGWTYRVTGVDPQGKYARKPGVVGDALKMVQNMKPQGLLQMFPPAILDAVQIEMPLGKASDVDTKVLAPLRNKVQAGAILSAVVGGVAQVATNYASPLQIFAGMLEPYKDDVKYIGTMFMVATVASAVCVLVLNIKKIREPGIQN